MSQKVDLSILILNWNTREELRECLRSLEHQSCKGISVEVIVIDNASQDGSPEMVRQEFPWVKLTVNPKNLGFSAGCNVGIREARGRYLLLLNPDTLAQPGALANLLRFAEEHPEAGIIGAKLLNTDGSLQYSARSFPNLLTGFFRDTPLGRLFPKNRFNREYLLQDWDHNSPREVDWVSGAAMLLRREVIEKVGLLDERFFFSCEDVDLCYRAWQAGWKVMYCPDAVFIHHIARSSDKAATRILALRHLAIYRYYMKHQFTGWNRLLWPVVVLGLLGRAIMLIVKNRIDVYRMRRQQAKSRSQEPGG